MRATSHPVAVWLLALVFVGVADVAITHTRVLWGPTAFEHTRDLRHVVFAQTYQAARAIYADDDPRPSVVLLGNSRVWLGARERLVQEALDRRLGAPAVRVHNLGIFGAGLGDQEMLVRHLPRMAPRLAVVTLAGTDLLVTGTTPLAGVPAQLMRTGWTDGPLAAPGTAARLDRVTRMMWPLWRFREFARAAIDERVVGSPAAEPFPDRFADTRALFRWVHGAEEGDAVERLYESWKTERTLARWTAYLEVGSAGHLSLVRERVRSGGSPEQDGLAARCLDAALDRLARAGIATVVVLMPENPVLAADAGNEFHRPGVSDAAAALVTTIAERHAARVVDARGWMPVEAFVDYDHLFPDLSGFQEPLADEIAYAIRGRV